MQLFHIHHIQAGEAFQYALCGFFGCFIMLNESAHEAPLPFPRLKTALNDQQFQFLSIIAKNDTINREQKARLFGIVPHACDLKTAIYSLYMILSIVFPMSAPDDL